MTTPAELTTRTECSDLSRRIAILENRIAAAEACKFRLNRLIVARDNEIATLTATAERLQAELDRARAGLLDLPY